MNAFRWMIAVVLALAALPVTASQAILATAASTLFESTPFILAGVAAIALLPSWGTRLVPYLSCGCAGGPAARSLPAAAATWMLFGPLVSAARFAAAVAVARLRLAPPACSHDERDSPLRQLLALLPVALAAGALLRLAEAHVDLAHLSPALAFASGAILGLAAPCALGAVGAAAALRASAPPAAIGYLCVAGIFDLRMRRSPHNHDAKHDGAAYGLAALGCAFVAARRGDLLVHPHFTLALACSAIALACFAWRFRRTSAPSLRWAPALMLAGAIVHAPLPQYHATETTLAQAFPGERVDFTGVVTHTRGVTTLVRYAITCCRADAAPVVVRLSAPLPLAAGRWVHASGTLVTRGDSLRLRVEHFRSIAAPGDPFVYR